MRPLVAALALFVASPAFAAAPKDAGTAAVTGVVEVPLYAGDSADDARVYIEMKSGDQTLLFRVATGHGEVRLSSGGVGKAGTKAHGKDGEQTATIASLALGGATFTNVKAHVDEKLDVDGEIGLGAFPSLAWAVVPSKGVLRVAPKDQGPSLLSGVGGTAVAYTDVAAAKHKLGTGPKAEFDRSPFVVKANVSGVELDGTLALERPTSRVLREVESQQWFSLKGVERAPTPLGDAPGFDRAEERVEWRQVAVGGASVSTSVSRKGAGLRSAYMVPFAVGADVLGRADVAIDPSTSTLTVVPASTVAVQDRSATVEAELRKALEPKTASADAKDEAKDEKAEKAARAGALAGLADFLAQHGRWDEALAARTEATQLDASTCTTWLAHGDALFATSRPAEAAASYQRALDLYGPWGAMALADRKKAESAKAKADTSGGAYDSVLPQSHACHVAAGHLALAKAAQGDRAGVDALYPSKLDLDAGLAVAAGSAALRAGDATAAEAAFRQAIHLTRSSDAPEARAGLFLALSGRDAALARAQVEKTRFAGADGQTDPLIVEHWVRSLTASEGADKARAALTSFVNADPENAAFRVVEARQAASTGDTGGAAKAAAIAETSASRTLAAHPKDARALALKALARLAAGDAAGARTAADAAVAADASVGLGWAALAECQRAAGDTAGADASTKRAALADAENPVWFALAGK